MQTLTCMILTGFLSGCGGLHDGVPRDRYMDTPHGVEYQRMVSEVGFEHQKYAQELYQNDRMHRQREKEKRPDFKWSFEKPETLPPDLRERLAKQ